MIENAREGKQLYRDFIRDWRTKISQAVGLARPKQNLSAGTNKDWSLEGLRGLACFCVVNSHFIGVFYSVIMYYFQPPTQWPSPSTPIEKILSHPPITLFFNGYFAVTIFFALSGYVLTDKYFRTQDPSFLRSGAIKRYPRLVLPALASVLLAYVLLSTGQMKNHLADQVGASGWILEYYKEPVSFLKAMYLGLFGAPIVGEFKINNPLWTLKIELLGSLLLFVLYYIFELRHKALLAFWFVLFSVALSHAPLFSFYYITILLGSFIHLVAGWLKQRPKLALMIFILGLVAGSYDFSPRFALLRSLDLPASFPFAAEFNADKRAFYWALGGVLTVAGVVGSPQLTRILSIGIFRFLGKISFALYLLHFPIILSFSISMVRKGLHYGQTQMVAVLISYVLTLGLLLIASSLFYKWVDSPCIRLASWMEKRVSAGKLSLKSLALNKSPQEVAKGPANSQLIHPE